MTPLTETSMQAAEAILAQGFVLLVDYVKAGTGELVECVLAGRGEEDGTALLTAWTGEELHHKSVPFAQVLLPDATAGRLGIISKTQRRQAVIDDANKLRSKVLQAREEVAA